MRTRIDESIFAAAAPVCHCIGTPPVDRKGLESSSWYIVIYLFFFRGLYNGVRLTRCEMIQDVLFQVATYVFSALASIVGASVSMDCIGALYGAYNRASMRLEDETWLRENCKDPVFFSKMRSHTSVCSEVEANARVGAFWAALHEVTDVFRVTWQPWAVGWVYCVVAFIPLVWACTFRRGWRVCRYKERLPGCEVYQGGGRCKDVFA